jgi:HD-like signal output (HDOD) protein
MKAINNSTFKMDNLFILSNFKKQESVNIFKNKLKIDNVFNSNSIKLSELKSAVINRCEDTKGLIEIPINDKISLIELIEYIEPLPQTLVELKEVCFSSTSSIKDIVRIIEKDPMFSSIVLRSVNSPYIGLTNHVTKVQIAVSLLGKKQIGTMTIVESAKEGLGDGNLESYNLSLSDAVDVSLQRVQFVSEWIKYIDISQDAKDDVISLIYLLPLGLVITNQAIIHGKLTKRFINLTTTTKDVNSIEKLLIGFNNLDALEKIFSIWGIHPNLMKILRNVKSMGLIVRLMS